VTIESKRFTLSGITDRFMNSYDNLGSFLSAWDLKSLLWFAFDKANDKCDVGYQLISDNGKMITIGGLMYNTETGFLCLGYNSNSNAYIPITSFVDVLNFCCYTDKKKFIDLEACNYIVENMKLTYGSFKPFDFVEGLEKGSSLSGKKSIVLNIVANDIVKSGAKLGKSYLAIYSDDDFYRIVFEVMAGILQKTDNLLKELFGNAIPEENRGEVISGVKGKFSAKDINKYKFETSYLKALQDRGADPEFVREVSSCNIGRKSRNNLLSSVGNSNPSRALFILSGWAYLEVWDSTSFGTITNDRIMSYNVLDLLRGLDNEQDVYFSYDMLYSNKDSRYLDALLKKLDLTLEVDAIGKDKFLESIKNFSKNVSLLRDRGSGYSVTVKTGQKDFLVYATKEMLNAGKIVDKVSKRLLAKF
jgi:hypothetical protein